MQNNSKKLTKKWVRWLEEWGLKITSAKVEVKVEDELGKNIVLARTCLNKGGLKIEELAFSYRLIVIIMVYHMYHICFRKINVIFNFERL